jgi:hypothetical protein
MNNNLDEMCKIVNKSKKVVEKIINDKVYIKEAFAFSNNLNSLNTFDNTFEVESVNQIIHYSPLILRCFYSRKGTWIEYNNISIEKSHPSYNSILNRRIPKYMNDVIETALDFKYENENGYTSVKIIGFIYLNTFINKWILKEESINRNFYNKFIDDFDIHHFCQYKDRDGNLLCDKEIKGSALSGFKWYNILKNKDNKINTIINTLSPILSSDITNYILKDYLALPTDYMIKNNVECTLDNNTTNTNINGKWKCKFYYYNLISKKCETMLTNLSYENNIELGFPLYYSKDKKYYRADILFILESDTDQSNILFQINDVAKIINLNVSEYQDIINGM